MPNWCINTLTITGTRLDLIQFLDGLFIQKARYKRTAEEEETYARLGHPIKTDAEFFKPCASFQAYCPIPEAILEAGYDRAGYEWQESHWGTKWDLDPSDSERIAFLLTKLRDIPDTPETQTISFPFSTAWTPPREWLTVAAARFDTLAFELYFTEEADCFAGISQYEHGVCIKESVYPSRIFLAVIELNDLDTAMEYLAFEFDISNPTLAHQDPLAFQTHVLTYLADVIQDGLAQMEEVQAAVSRYVANPSGLND